jgi:pyruvate-formate lyase-activating enzyme
MNRRQDCSQTSSSVYTELKLMSKTPPKPPVTDPASPYESFNSKKLHEAAERALDHYLVPAQIMATPYIPNNLFMVNPQSDTESLLANACESLASATVMLGNFAGTLEGSNRNALLGIAQVVMLGELAVNQALDNVVPND